MVNKEEVTQKRDRCFKQALYSRLWAVWCLSLFCLDAFAAIIDFSRGYVGLGWGMAFCGIACLVVGYLMEFDMRPKWQNLGQKYQQLLDEYF